jgi:thiol-disulfide isomerase/thioredoxin
MMRGTLLALIFLTAPSATGQEPNPTPRQEYDALIKEYAAASDVWSKKYDEAPGKADPVKRHYEWPAWSFAPRFLKLAEDHPRDSAALDALLWVVALDRAVGENDKALLPFYERALETLAKHHLQDKRVHDLCLTNVAADLSVPAERFLRTAMEAGPTREARGYACLGLARLLAAKRAVAQDPWFDRAAKTPFDSYNKSRLDPSFFEYIHTADSQALYDEAGRLFERTIVEFADIKSPQRGRPLAEIAQSDLHELRHLSLGQIAPEIQGTDADGNAFKLSDYRGKVVVLTFSGNWCGPCRGMYPDERELVKNLKDKPFALLSVNTDADRATLQKSIKDGEITWRCWWDGGKKGSICVAWNVNSFPTVYVLDGTGAIRFKDLRGPSLIDAVHKLLKKQEAPSGDHKS